MSHRQGFVSNTQWLIQESTLGARDFSSAVSGFCQVFIVTRASPLVASAFGQHRIFPPHARKTSGTQGTRRGARPWSIFRPNWGLVCYTAVFSVVTQRSFHKRIRGPLRDDTETAVKQTNWDRKGQKKNVLETAPPLLSQGLDDRPPRLSQGLDPALIRVICKKNINQINRLTCKALRWSRPLYRTWSRAWIPVSNGSLDGKPSKSSFRDQVLQRANISVRS